MTTTNNFAERETNASDGGTSSPRSTFVKQADRLLRDVPIAKVVGEYTKLRGRKRLVGRCPLHEESNPVLSVNPKTNTFRCLGCGAAGDAIDFLQKVRGLTYGQALEALEVILYSDEYPDAS